MTAPYFKARWNQQTGYVQASAILDTNQVQEILKKKNATAYVKYVTVDTHVRFAQVVQIAEGDDLDVLLIVAAGTQQPHSYLFHLDTLPAMSSWDTIELKTLGDAEVKKLGLPKKEDLSDYIPCPQAYLDAISSQEDMNAQPEGW